MSKQVTLTTARPNIARLGMGGRVKSQFVQPVYTYKGQLVAHMSGKLRPIEITGEDTATVDLLAQPALDFSDDKPKRSELAQYLANIGATVFAPAKAKAAKQPAKGKAKAAPAKPAEPAAPAEGGHDLASLVSAIMASAAPMEQKIEAIAALRG
jgi:hypothetical protein